MQLASGRGMDPVYVEVTRLQHGCMQARLPSMDVFTACHSDVYRVPCLCTQ